METRILGLHALATEVERYAPGTNAAGRRAETLVKTDDLRIVLVTMERDIVLREHTAPGTVSIQALTGQFAVHVEDDDILLDAGSMLTLAAGVQHSVLAISGGAFLLTIAWSANTL